MISLKKITTILIALLFVNSVTAQDLLTFVPKNSSFVSVVNVEQINTKANFAKLIELPFVQKIDKEIAKEISKELVKNGASPYLDLQKYGIKTNSKTYSYFVSEKNIYYAAMLLSLSDKNKFTEFAKQITNDIEGKEIITKNNYLQTQKSDLQIIWNNNTAAIFGVALNPAYRDTIETRLRKQYNIKKETYNPYEIIEETTDENTEEAPEEENNTQVKVNIFDLKYAAIDSIKNEWFKNNTAQFLQSKGANSFAANTEFKAYLKSNPEAAFVIDYGLLTKVYTNSFLRSMYSASEFGMPYNYLLSMYDGMKMYAKAETQKDAVAFSFDIKYSKKINEIFAQVKKKKISKDFLKYLNKDVMGYYAMGIDIEGYSEGLKQMLKNTLPEIPEYGVIGVSTMDILELIVDEKALYKVFTGDMVLAINGITDLEVIHKSYDYDEEFNRFEIIDTSMQKMPELSLMLGIGNGKDVQKIVDLLVNTKVFKKTANVYSLDIKNNKFPVHFSISNNILFISNNKNYVQKPTIYTKDQQVNKAHSKLFNKNTFVAYANTAEIARYFADNEASFKDKKMLTESSNLFKHIMMYGNTKKSFMHTKYIIQLSESDDNSIADILKFMNELYIINDKKI